MSKELLNSNLNVPLWRDYLELCKPNVVALMALTTVVGMFLSVPGMVPLNILIIGNIGIGLRRCICCSDQSCC